MTRIGNVLADRRTHDSLGGLHVQLLGQLFHPLPGDEEGCTDDEHDGSAKEQLALGSQGDFPVAEALEHGIGDCNAIVAKGSSLPFSLPQRI